MNFTSRQTISQVGQPTENNRTDKYISVPLKSGEVKTLLYEKKLPLKMRKL